MAASKKKEESGEACVKALKKPVGLVWKSARRVKNAPYGGRAGIRAACWNL